MPDDLTGGIYLVRAFGLIEPFAERLREADSREKGEPLPNYKPLVEALNECSGRAEAIAETYPDSALDNELRQLATEVRGLVAEHPTREGTERRLNDIGNQLDSLADDDAVTPDQFESVLDDFESLIVTVDTIHKGYRHLASDTELEFRN